MSKATPIEAYLSPDFQFEFHQTNVWMTRLRFCTTASERVYTLTLGKSRSGKLKRPPYPRVTP
jgi:hypothetical protein